MTFDSAPPSLGRSVVERVIRILTGWVLLMSCPLVLAQDGVFDLLEFEVEGNTTLDAVEIERAVYPFLGPGKTVEDVRGARAALEKTYQDAGFLTVTVDVPPQQIRNGKVTLRVVDGVVSKLAVTGNRYRSRDYVRSRLPALAPGTVPYFPDAQKELAAFNQVPGRAATPVMRPGTKRGEVEMEIRLQEEFPLHGNVEVNNRQAVNTDELRLSGSVRYDNLWGRDHSATLLYLTSPQDTTQVRAFSANYLFRPGGSNNLVAFYAVRSRSTVATLGNATVIGNGNIYGVRGIFPLAGRDRDSHSLVFGADYKESFQDVTIGTPGSSASALTYAPLTAQYNFARQGEKGITRFTAGTSLVVRGALFGNRDDEFARRRFRASANYATLRLELSRQQKLARAFTAYGRLVGHTASQPLVNLEQFIVAGADGVRGYYEAEVLGDDGWLAQVEARSPSLLDGGEGEQPRELIAVGFVDAASVRLKSPLPGQSSHETPWSAGLGLRFRAQPSLTASLEVGIPMEAAQSTRAREPRLHFKVAYDF